MERQSTNYSDLILTMLEAAMENAVQIPSDREPAVPNGPVNRLQRVLQTALSSNTSTSLPSSPLPTVSPSPTVQTTEPMTLPTGTYVPNSNIQPDEPPSTEPPVNIHIEFLYEYNRTIREYQSTMREYMQLLPSLREQGRVPIDQTRDQTHGPRPIPAQIPRPRPTQTPVQRQEPNDQTLLFSYIYYPAATRSTPTQSTVPLTREEIARTTRTYGYTDAMVSADSSSNVCPISLDPFYIGDVVCEIRGCGHVFKRPPLMNWLRRNSRCPVCRYELRNFTEPTSSTEASSSSSSTEASSSTYPTSGQDDGPNTPPSQAHGQTTTTPLRRNHETINEMFQHTIQNNRQNNSTDLFNDVWNRLLQNTDNTFIGSIDIDNPDMFSFDGPRTEDRNNI